MFRKTIETSATPAIAVTECTGDLVIRGSALLQVDVHLRNGAMDAAVQQAGDAITVTAHSDCSITCPLEATVTIQAVRGDLRLKGLRGAVAIGAVNGDVALRDVGPATLQKVHGDVTVRQVDGPLTIEALTGDGRIRAVNGPLALGEVGGDLWADGLQGGLDARWVGADVSLGSPFPPGTAFRVKAGSDLDVRLPPDASVRFSLRSGGQTRSYIPELELVKRDGVFEGVMGTGEAVLEAEVGGRVRLLLEEPGGVEESDFGFAADIEGLGVEIGARIAEAMAEMEARLEQSLAMVDRDALRLKVQRATEKAQRATERAAEEARRAAEREAERARMRAERAERRWQRASGQRPAPPRPSPTDEERIRILRLVEEGKITPEQAIDLLSALEGR